MYILYLLFLLFILLILFLLLILYICIPYITCINQISQMDNLSNAISTRQPFLATLDKPSHLTGLPPQRQSVCSLRCFNCFCCFFLFFCGQREFVDGCQLAKRLWSRGERSLSWHCLQIYHNLAKSDCRQHLCHILASYSAARPCRCRRTLFSHAASAL